LDCHFKKRVPVHGLASRIFWGWNSSFAGEVKVPAVSKHLKNIFDTHELLEDSDIL